MCPIIFDRESGIPLYRQLADYIKKQISSGEYHPGDVLPSEADYIKELKLSRTTVRLAIGSIANAGLVKREQGRGTIVVSQVRSKLPFLSSFTEEALLYGREPSVILLKCEEEQVSIEAANALSLPPDAKIFKVIRLRMADKFPIGLAVSWINTIVFPQLKDVDFSALSLYQIFESELGLPIRNAVENIHADLAGDYEARNLKIKNGAPVLQIMRTTFLQGEQDSALPIEYVEVVFNGSVYSVDVELYRQSGK